MPTATATDSARTGAASAWAERVALARTGIEHSPGPSPHDRRRRWPLFEMAVGDWFTFAQPRITSIRSSCLSATTRHDLVFMVGRHPDNPNLGICIRIG